MSKKFPVPSWRNSPICCSQQAPLFQLSSLTPPDVMDFSPHFYIEIRVLPIFLLHPKTLQTTQKDEKCSPRHMISSLAAQWCFFLPWLCCSHLHTAANVIFQTCSLTSCIFIFFLRHTTRDCHLCHIPPKSLFAELYKDFSVSAKTVCADQTCLGEHFASGITKLSSPCSVSGLLGSAINLFNTAWKGYSKKSVHWVKISCVFGFTCQSKQD